ncbi:MULTISPECIES: DUF2325 domain-containing protein [unclassified Janthinobacterium]|uniref:DUF2325 domain-containing protein n=1 Tax=unclassified Janthinobacterium TaxID=2610881 RepID=UPI001611071B|nr:MULTISPECIES: DUF2325 domain-containing protein [unclassified Janthinobacterium]MBB5368984.1 hypothetical protein [Janthinobacterium sp. K2C7]MBB5381480.1 hypothetical protein [Janthinobacterium sp. K2Li3]MBB5387366.1 hypothetical protein [Janthinobacterium sp. K2E3]
MSSLTETEILIAHEHRVLLDAYGRAQARCSAQLAQQAARIAQLEAQLMRTQAKVVMRDTQLALVREELAALGAAAPGLPTRVRLARRVEWLSERVQDLMRELLRLQWVPAPSALPQQQTSLQPQLLAQLREKAVLCVGQDLGQAAGGVYVAQQAIEQAGGRFLHHAGAGDGAEDAAALEASLVAADLVICQTGCVSHDAYWRVHDHCKRTGKQCVLVDQPQAMHFVRKETLVS